MIYDDLIKKAIEVGSSDVHLAIGEYPKFRTAAGIINAEGFNRITLGEIYEIYDYLIAGNVALDRTYKEERKLDLSFESQGTRQRVNLSFSNGFPIMTSRIINDELPRFEDLGLPEKVREMAYISQGLILVTGKTNSGKTTTLNCLIDDINRTCSKKIITLEDPVEYLHKSDKSLIIQKEVGEGKDVRTFDEGVTNALREDPDIIVVGEIRDRETIEAAINIAESGHLVIATLHTRSSAETLDRIINFYDLSLQQNIKFLLASILRLIVAQKLIPINDTEYIMAPEIMVTNKKISAVIRKPNFIGSEIEDTIQASSEIGSQSMIDALAKLVISRKLTLDQAKAELDESRQDTLLKTIVQMQNYSKQN